VSSEPLERADNVSAISSLIFDYTTMTKNPLLWVKELRHSNTRFCDTECKLMLIKQRDYDCLSKCRSFYHSYMRWRIVLMRCTRWSLLAASPLSYLRDSVVQLWFSRTGPDRRRELVSGSMFRVGRVLMCSLRRLLRYSPPCVSWDLVSRVNSWLWLTHTGEKWLFSRLNSIFRKLKKLKFIQLVKIFPIV
jgi:hypothetical protein